MPETRTLEELKPAIGASASLEKNFQYYANPMPVNSALTDLNFYEHLLQTAVCNKSTEVYPNSGKDHAAIALSVLFSNTKESMNLLVNDFNGNVSNNPKYVSALSDCLGRGVTVNIITLQPAQDSEGYLLFKKYKEERPEKIKIYEATPETRNYLSEQINAEVSLGELFNVATFDSDKYRLEILPSKYTALISFSNPPKVKRFNEIFMTAITTSTLK
jgi:hypothetical protein